MTELFSILENKPIGYADDSTLMAVVPSPGVRLAVAESLIRDLGRVSEWCDLCGLTSKTKTMIGSRSRTRHPQSHPLTIGGTVLKESEDLVILEVTFDSKMNIYIYAPPLCRTSQYRRTFIHLSVSLWNDLSDPVFDGVGLAGFKSRANAYFLA